MRATRSINAIFGEHEALDRFAVHDVGFDNLVDIVRRNPSVPDSIRINDHGGSVLALIQTSRHVGAHSFFEASKCELLFEEKLQLGLARRIAATARMAWIALIAADEQMPFKLGHNPNLQDFGGGGRG
jgi:hypothetical protein